MLQTHAELLAGADELSGHAAQLAPSAAEYLPTPQSIQLLKFVAPAAAEAVPCAHWVHTVAPVLAENVPAAQLVQAV
jgi:hypothetical protein